MRKPRKSEDNLFRNVESDANLVLILVYGSVLHLVTKDDQLC